MNKPLEDLPLYTAFAAGMLAESEEGRLWYEKFAKIVGCSLAYAVGCHGSMICQRKNMFPQDELDKIYAELGPVNKEFLSRLQARILANEDFPNI